MVSLTHNVLEVSTKCPSCSMEITAKVNFQYGGTMEEKYRIGDSIEWGGNDIGEPGCRKVVLYGAGLECPVCEFEDIGDFEIHVENDKFVNAQPLTTLFNFKATDDSFIVIEA